MAKIAQRVCWQLKQQEAVMPRLQLSALEQEGKEIPGEQPTAEAQLATRHMKQASQGAIAKLPSLYADGYKLRDIEGVPEDEVARRLGIARAGDEISPASRARTDARTIG